MEKPLYFNEWEPSFSQHRPYLISFTFRMTGSLAEAEDLVQDVFIEAAKTDPSTIESHKSWLTKICSHRALDLLKSAYKQRESYSGTWLPDAVPDSLQYWNLPEADSADKNLIITESLTTSFLLLLERLNPEERAVYLLNEIFEYSFKEISEFLNKSEAACRKIAQRAREFISTNKKRFEPAEGANPTKLISQFFETARTGNTEALSLLLSDSSEFWADGGGKISAVPHILRTPFDIARFFAGIYSSRVKPPYEMKMELHPVSGRPGVVISKKLPSGDWAFETLISFEFEDGKIARIYSQRNPDKLARLTSLR
ncbi:sigma-70 family RNA polymerase sigma factor [Bdellovibrio bacteriovorus]|uniref:RNA polymerase sigma factor SigJ n=1 Tax=Bdellovibrio bacteriovorus str. Tiberius TaxID=1069642 RepID=K7YZS0_BDEBC|nr:sigma-70 family RNA polymerase sigma factor [Bdellovibrio bacteriovorus]AFY03253.1 RNA polymerase sigma factor SigJ [Bdellovibrio bacteriovorus str. Tiberius]